MGNTDQTKLAFTETYEIIKHSNKEIQDKISLKFLNLIERNRDTSYIPNIDYSKSLDNQNILHETKIILGIIYRDYLCTPEERQRLIQNENELLRQIEKEKQEKYSVDNLFRNTKYAQTSETTNNIEQNRSTDIIVSQEEKWYKKIWNSIIKVFKGMVK